MLAVGPAASVVCVQPFVLPSPTPSSPLLYVKGPGDGARVVSVRRGRMFKLIPLYVEWLMGNEFPCCVCTFFPPTVWENYLLSGRKDRLCCDCQVLPNPLAAASAPSVP